MKATHQTIYILAIIFVACSPSYTLQSYDNDLINVEANIDSNILNIIIPYQNEIEAQMNEVLTFNINALNKGKPQSTLGNFVADLCLNYSNADMCILNNGGLRTNINIGYVTRGKIYELMPFDNELVLLKK